jgi:hypothetical protein
VNDTLTCLPSFHILGGFQSGAWSLFELLSGHPQVLRVSAIRH